MGIIRQHFIISGTVQGVGFRYHSQQQALKLGITGWVKNLASGQVEIIAEADTDTLDEFKQWLEIGPTYAQVTDIRVENDAATAEFSTFKIHR
jgi:acylphosphatase